MEGGAVLVFRPQRAGQVGPAKVLEGPAARSHQRVARQHQHPVLAGETAEAPGVAGPSGFAVAVAVTSGVMVGGRVGVGVGAGLISVLFIVAISLTESMGKQRDEP